ncbi:MAG: hypothetical protein LBR22_03590 [Desulfovibrio sp.]|jgi:outer membrane protein assembly factor BamB|nr:hypothetical protein [Desulfovibrio sp.]
MKKTLSLIPLCLCLMLAVAMPAKAAQAAKAVTDYKEYLPAHTYTLKDSHEVKGRQGIAADDKFYYVSGSKAIFKYDRQFKLVASNEQPFEGYAIPSNHIGDIDVYNGELFISAEWFEDGVGKDIQIAIHDADTLKFKRTFKFEPSSGQQEVSGICVDRDKKTVWMCSWVGEDSGRYLYEYDLATGKYLRKVHIMPVPQWVQGVFYYKGALYLTADDGEADYNEPDHVYRVNITKDGTYATVAIEKTITEVKRQGEIEGLCVDPVTNDLMVLYNRGARIILGMPKGFYEGYDKEISEVYRFAMAPVKK